MEGDGQAPDTKAQRSEVSTAKASRVMFRWSSEMIAQLTAEFLAAPLNQSISAVAKAIAARHGWTPESTEYKIYHLDLPDQREAQSQGSVKPDGDEVRQAEGDAAVVGSALEQESALPATLATEKRSERQMVNALPVGPVELRRGNFVWDVRIDGAVQRWYLDYPYGSFPVQEGLVVYQGITYALQVVGINTVRAMSAQTEPMKVQAAEKRALAG